MPSLGDIQQSTKASTGSRPFVIARHGLTLDGRVLDWDLPIPRSALVGSTTTIEAMRAESADMVLTGADTLWPFPPRWPAVPGTPAAAPTNGSPADLYQDRVLPQRDGSVRYAITDSRGRLPSEFFIHQLGDGSTPAWPGGPVRDAGKPPLDMVMLVSRRTSATYLEFLRRHGISYIVRGEERVDLDAALSCLAIEHGIRRVLADGGVQLPTALLRAGLVDEIVFHYYPVILGAAGMTAYQVATPNALSAPVVVAPVRISPLDGGGIAARYRILPAPQQ